MFGNKDRLRKRLKENGTAADAEILEVKERPWVNKRPGEIGAAGVYHFKLRVNPPRELSFETDITDEWRDQLGEPAVGGTVGVVYDPDDHSRVVLADRTSSFGGDPELLALSELEAAEGYTGGASPAPAGASESRLDRLQKLADLHDRGALSDAEFAAEKARILSES